MGGIQSQDGYNEGRDDLALRKDGKGIAELKAGRLYEG